jgi:hypothetical protein
MYIWDSILLLKILVILRYCASEQARFEAPAIRLAQVLGELVCVGTQDDHNNVFEDAAEADGVSNLLRGGDAAIGRPHLEARLLRLRSSKEGSVRWQRHEARCLDGDREYARRLSTTNGASATSRR